MATKNPKINVTFEETTAVLLASLAASQEKSLSCLIRELALEALELREDFYLSKMALQIDNENTKLYGHLEAWQ
jgi:hypothetical protein